MLTDSETKTAILIVQHEAITLVCIRSDRKYLKDYGKSTVSLSKSIEKMNEQLAKQYQDKRKKNVFICSRAVFICSRALRKDVDEEPNVLFLVQCLERESSMQIVVRLKNKERCLRRDLDRLRSLMAHIPESPLEEVEDACPHYY